MPAKKLELAEFLPLYRELIAEPTYTAKKYAIREKLFKLLTVRNGEVIGLYRHSPSCKVHQTQHFTVFKVRTNQRGHLSRYSGKWILMYSFKSHGFTHFFYVNDLRKGEGSPELIERLKDEFKGTFIPATA